MVIACLALFLPWCFFFCEWDELWLLFAVVNSDWTFQSAQLHYLLLPLTNCYKFSLQSLLFGAKPLPQYLRAGGDPDVHYWLVLGCLWDVSFCSKTFKLYFNAFIEDLHLMKKAVGKKWTMQGSLHKCRLMVFMTWWVFLVLITHKVIVFNM